MRNETPVWRVYERVFGAEDVATLQARSVRRNLWQLDHLLRALCQRRDVADVLRKRGKMLPDLADLHPAVLQMMRAWAVSDFSLEARICLQPMFGEPVTDVCAALEALPQLTAAGLSGRDIQELLYEGYSVAELARALSATNGIMEYALALIQPDTPRVPPF